MSHTIYVTQIILRPLSALFGLQFMLPIENNRNYSAILAALQITSYALGVYIALLFTCQLHESLIFYISIKILISFAWLDFT